MPLINYIANRQECLGGGAGGFVRGAAPPPPPLIIDYLVVGGGDAVYLTGYGGGAGGFLTGSASMSFNDTLHIEVGDGGTDQPNVYGEQSSISSSLFGVQIASGAVEGSSGEPTSFNAGLGGPPPIGKGGGAGSSENGVNGVVGLSGRGGSGSLWLNGKYYAGGGGGGGNATLPAGSGEGGIGGGGYGEPGGCTTCPSGSNGEPNTGGGAGGGMTQGGSGIVIIRYSTGSLRMADGGNQFESGGYFYHEFTGSGTLFYGYQ